MKDVEDPGEDTAEYRLYSWILAILWLLLLGVGAYFFLSAIVGCTFEVQPIIEVQDANVQIGPIQVCPGEAGVP